MPWHVGIAIGPLLQGQSGNWKEEQGAQLISELNDRGLSVSPKLLNWEYDVVAHEPHDPHDEPEAVSL